MKKDYRALFPGGHDPKARLAATTSRPGGFTPIDLCFTTLPEGGPGRAARASGIIGAFAPEHSRERAAQVLEAFGKQGQVLPVISLDGDALVVRFEGGGAAIAFRLAAAETSLTLWLDTSGPPTTSGTFVMAPGEVDAAAKAFAEHALRVTSGATK